MKFVVLGGCGIQGRTTVIDLARSKGVEKVICADTDLSNFGLITDQVGDSKVESQAVDASDQDRLVALMEGADVVLDLLPRTITEPVCRAALKAGVSIVNTNYGHPIRDLDGPAKEAGITILPESGLDPGIDLILYGEGRRRFDELTRVDSYCGGVPDRAACTNPLNYKISWTWEGVLSSTKRDSRLIIDGQERLVSAAEQHETDLIHEIDFPGLGSMEAIPNGDAVFFTDLLGTTESIIRTGRWTLRWPGWSAFWAPLKRLGFLEDEVVPNLEVSPYRFLVEHLGPRLQFGPEEKDLVVMVNIFEGFKDGQKKRYITRLLIERDLESGLMAMSQGVGYTASIVAQMIARGEIRRRGVLSPVTEVPYGRFIEELASRGVLVEEEEQII